MGAGVTDLNQLTDTLFYLLHPELRGRRIGPSQRDLARQWIEIRDRRVGRRWNCAAGPQRVLRRRAQPGGVRTFFGVDTADWENQNADWLRAKAQVPIDFAIIRASGAQVRTLFPPHLAEAQGRGTRTGRIPVPELSPQGGLAVQPCHAGQGLHHDGTEPG